MENKHPESPTQIKTWKQQVPTNPLETFLIILHSLLPELIAILSFIVFTSLPYFKVLLPKYMAKRLILLFLNFI